MGKKCGKFKFFQKVLIKILIISKNHGYLDLSRFVSIVSIGLDDLDKYLKEDKSRLKNLDFKNINFKNLDREKLKVHLDVMDNLDTSKKLVSTRRTFSISIGLNCRDPQA
jgi:hypothetical protein